MQIKTTLRYHSTLNQDIEQGLVAQSCPTLCNPRTTTCQAPLSMEFSMQKYQNRQTFPSPRDLPNSGIESRFPTLQADSLFARMALTKKDNTNVGKSVKKLEASSYWCKCKMAQPLSERIWQFLKKLALYNLATQLLVIYPREIKTNAHMMTCMQYYQQHFA